MSVVFTLGLRNTYRRVKKCHPASTITNGFSVEGTNGATVMLLHGLTGTPNEMRFLASFLNKKGYSVIVPRLANHGEPLEVLRKSRWQEFYASVTSAFLSAGLEKSERPVFVGGLSFGALLALLLAYEYPTSISAVSCLAPTLFYDGWNTPMAKLFMPLACTPLKNFFYFKEEPPYGVRNEAIRSRIHKYYSKATLENMENVAQYGYPFFPVTQLYQLKLLVRYLSPRLSRIVVPVQMIQAKDDDLTSIKNSKYIYDNVGSPIKEMIFLYNSYHVITVDQEREIVAEKMEAFFNRALSTGHCEKEKQQCMVN
ncbi:MAG: alpha/beta fold hydrolase [Candidatus Omnitrophica bacterium]|nr:alpha/beta fold hydrolase [Candidatus Omnitrophota bacterium]MCM8791296.1 alpha/beta fold hydrolase [Candidatus Omnitrophota bacterium]